MIQYILLFSGLAASLYVMQWCFGANQPMLGWLAVIVLLGHLVLIVQQAGGGR